VAAYLCLERRQEGTASIASINIRPEIAGLPMGSSAASGNLSQKAIG
jgi:hypothetical protein